MAELRDLLAKYTVILDARTPKEFDQGHIPGAINFPLFSNEERHHVGLCYKEKGKDEAVKLGLRFVGPRMAGFIDEAEKLSPDRKALLYCWRGGMRSGSLSWLLKTAGFEIDLIPGGYKTWRRFVLDSFEQPLLLLNLSGYTGVGKTEVLAALADQGEQVLDLEGIANHRGSAFGQMGEQPTTEHFENEVAAKLLSFDLSKPIWVEDESRSIGKIYMPSALTEQMRNADMVLVDRDRSERIESICKLYGQAEIAELIAAFERIERRMGGQFTKAAIEHLNQGDLAAAADLALRYYDKGYEHSRNRRKKQHEHVINIQKSDYESAAIALIEWKNNKLKP